MDRGDTPSGTRSADLPPFLACYDSAWISECRDSVSMRITTSLVPNCASVRDLAACTTFMFPVGNAIPNIPFVEVWERPDSQTAGKRQTHGNGISGTLCKRATRKSPSRTQGTALRLPRVEGRFSRKDTTYKSGLAGKSPAHAASSPYLMATSSRGVSGPSGRVGPQPAPAQIPGGGHPTREPAYTQTSPEQSTANQIRKLTVRLLTDSFNLIWAHNLPVIKAHHRNIPQVARGTIGDSVS